MTRRIGIISIVFSLLLVAPFVFAESGQGSNGENGEDGQNGSGHDFKLPFTGIGTSTDALLSQIQSLQSMLNDLKGQRKAFENDRRAEHASSSNATSTDDRDDDHGTSDIDKGLRDAFKDQIKDVKNQLKTAKKELRFARSLSRGMSGDDVRDLQEKLAEDEDHIFDSSNVTGFFGPLTEEAVKKFQRKHGIDQVGIFGPKTQQKILSMFVDQELPADIVNDLRANNASTTPGFGVITICHHAASSTQTMAIAVPSVLAHLLHGDSIGVCPVI